MASDITLPELGENVSSGTVVDVKVKTGDRVQAGQDLLEVSGGKATMPVPAPMAGVITEVLVKVDDEVEAGQVLFRIDAAPAGETSPPAAKKDPAPARSAPLAKPAAPASPPPPPAPAPAPSAASQPATVAERPLAAAVAVGDARPVPASPATRLLARSLGVEINQVPGSARNGRVTSEDVKAFVRKLASSATRPGGGAALQAPPLPDFGKWGTIERQPLSQIRRETARHMSVAWSLIPHVTQHDLADITDLEAFRKAQQEDKSNRGGPRLTVTAFALKAAAIALQQFPQFAASLDLGNNQLILKKYYHIGLAVDTPRGLMVPILRDVDRKSVHALAQEMAEIAEKARAGKLGMADLQGGTFTITNLGGIGGTAFTPIVNHPEVAILGMSRSRLEPVVREGQIVPRLLLPLSLSYDHRVIDGADAARFTRQLVEMLENPLVMLLHA